MTKIAVRKGPDDRNFNRIQHDLRKNFLRKWVQAYVEYVSRGRR